MLKWLSNTCYAIFSNLYVVSLQKTRRKRRFIDEDECVEPGCFTKKEKRMLPIALTRQREMLFTYHTTYHACKEASENSKQTTTKDSIFRTANAQRTVAWRARNTNLVSQHFVVSCLQLMSVFNRLPWKYPFPVLLFSHKDSLFVCLKQFCITFLGAYS